MLLIKKSEADLYYRKLKSNDSNPEEIIEFLITEANNIINLETLLNQCKDDIIYDFNLPLMLKSLNKIRTNKLNIFKEHFSFWEFKKKKYFEKLLHDAGYYKN